jgi:hypothetical protein
MTIFKIDRDNFENTSIQAAPSKSFSSSSMGVTGTLFVYPRRSDALKEVIEFPTRNPRPQSFDDASLERQFQDARTAIQNDIADIGSSTDHYGNMDKILSFINTALPPSPIINHTTASIHRLTRSVDADRVFEKKRYIVDNLYPANRVKFPSSHFSYTNYHSLNFFTASQVPTRACLLYPNSASIEHESRISGSYVVSDAFTFEFHIKPKNLFVANDSGYNPGTILHLSSSYAVSLVSGSSVDEKGNSDKFRIQLQLSHSADVTPSLAVPGGYPNDLIFLSEDNALSKNDWHHVAIKWKSNRDASTGSFVVNSKEAGTFVLPSSSIAPEPYGADKNNPAVLVVGNYYEGTNEGTSAQSRFFSEKVATNFGLKDMDPGVTETLPDVFDFTSPLCAEIHDLKIYETYREDEQIQTGSIQGSGNRQEAGLLLHVPPFFTKQSPARNISTTLTSELTASTETPFNTDLSFRVAGHDLNIENFTRDLKTLNFPRHMSLTGSSGYDLPVGGNANDALFEVPEVRYRNLFLLPCDDGNFAPNFSIVETGSIPTGPVKSGSLFYHYTNDMDFVDLSMIKLRELIPSQSFPTFPEEVAYESIRTITTIKQENPSNATPEAPKGDYYVLPFVYGRTLDNSSDEIVIFDVSKLYYGERIKPGTFEIQDTSLTGSGGQIGIKLKDDGFGNLYRADSGTSHATWNSVGNIFYEEGIAVVKSPNIPLFGKDQFSVSMKGEREVHAMKVHVIAPAASLNSSSNPSYIPVSASLNANEANAEFVAITGINFHDDNLNVIMKTKFAQPVIKRTDDRVMFKSKLDF